MSKNVEVVRSIYAAFARGDIPAILEHLADDVAWDGALAPGGAPWLQPRTGREGAGAFFASLGALEFRRFDVRAILDGGDLVVGVVDLEATVRATGRAIVETDETHVWRFDARGRVVRFRHGSDTRAHALAAG